MIPRLSRSIPLSVKLLVTAFLVSMALNHAFAGWLSFAVADSAAGGAKEHFEYKSLVYMLRMSHQHTFGHGIMYTVLGALFLLTGFSERVKAALVLLPFLGATVDLGSWWAMKYGPGDYEWMSYVGGTLFSVGFSVMSLRIFYDTWLGKETTT